jgi:hypothetical protein
MTLGSRRCYNCGPEYWDETEAEFLLRDPHGNPELLKQQINLYKRIENRRCTERCKMDLSSCMGRLFKKRKKDPFLLRVISERALND